MVSYLTNTMLGHWHVIIDPDKKIAMQYFTLIPAVLQKMPSCY